MKRVVTEMIYGDHQTKRKIGYWVISPERLGGYAYARVHSNGIVFYVCKDNIL